MKKMVKAFAGMLAVTMVMTALGCAADGNSGGGESSYTYIIDEDETAKGFVSAKKADGTDAKRETNTKNIGNKPASGGKFLDGADTVIYHIKSPVAQTAKVTVCYAHWGWTYQIRAGFISVNGIDYLEPEQILYYNRKGNMLVDSNTITIPLNAGDNQIRLMPVPKGTALTKYTAELGYGVIYPNGEADEQEAEKSTNVAGLYLSDGYLANFDYIKFETKKALSKGSDDTPSYYVVKTAGDFGTVKVEPVMASYPAGTEVTVTATAGSGYAFDSWCGSSVSTESSFKVTLTENKSFQAHFIPADFDKATELNGLEGYAAICDDNGTAYTVTGGFGGETITLATLADIESNKSKISGNDPYIIKVAARITTVDNKSLAFDVGSNKTLIGEAGKDYGFKNINPKVSGENVIIKNLHFGDVIGDDLWGGAGNDALSIKGGKHIWIDHCEFSSSIDPKNNDGTDFSFNDYKAAGGSVNLEGENTSEETKWKKDFYDGLLDVSEQSRFVSVSNCYFHDHWKACLCGGSNDKAEQQAQGSQVRLTMYNNYFKNIHARQPLFRFGKAHIYSSYLYGADDASGIEVRAKSEIYVDNVYFEHFKKSVGCWNSSSGDIGAGAWTVKDCDGVAADTSSNSTSYVPPYTWTKTSAGDSKTNLPGSAGIEK